MTDSATRPSTWELGPFTTHARAILGADPHLTFSCPVTGARVPWAAKDVFNPGAVVHDGKVHMLVRAEDHVGPFGGTSRIGLAVSRDGVHFTLEPEPVIYPADDAWRAWEWPGGCEDPRVMESPDGGFVCLYTTFDGKSATLFVATSPDLRVWEKHGPVFAGTRHAKRWSKSGSIVTKLRDGRLVAARINDRYWMYWGEGVCFAATSDDLVRWEPSSTTRIPTDTSRSPATRCAPVRWRVDAVPGTRALRPLLLPRPGRFDSLLVEPGPPAVSHDRMASCSLYNGANHPAHRRSLVSRRSRINPPRCCSTGPIRPHASHTVSHPFLGIRSARRSVRGAGRQRVLRAVARAVPTPRVEPQARGYGTGKSSLPGQTVISRIRPSSATSQKSVPGPMPPSGSFQTKL